MKKPQHQNYKSGDSAIEFTIISFYFSFFFFIKKAFPYGGFENLLFHGIKIYYPMLLDITFCVTYLLKSEQLESILWDFHV